jgi:SAM-dependent methyltransferase
MTENCPLCNSKSEVFYNAPKQLFYKCDNCFGIFLSRDLLPTNETEIERYQYHNNDVNDLNYQKFVSPIVNSVKQHFNSTHKGLDFGAGTGPVLSKMLQEANYQIKQYDPFFHNYPELLNEKYDYIASCEVIEHFHYPYKEFELLKKMLQPNGKLFCMTDIYNPTIDFANWYYKNDPTHVFIYQKETFEWIKTTFNFSDLTIDKRLVSFYY